MILKFKDNSDKTFRQWVEFLHNVGIDFGKNEIEEFKKGFIETTEDDNDFYLESGVFRK